MKWKHWSLAIAIAILFAIFINLGVSTFYPGPDFENFKPEDCLDERVPKPVQLEGEPIEYETREECFEWSNDSFQNSKNKYERNVFIILIIGGIIGIVLGVVLTVSSVAAGLLYGGILTLFIAVVRYWGNLQDYARFIIVGIALAFLIWLGYKKLK